VHACVRACAVDARLSLCVGQVPLRGAERVRVEESMYVNGDPLSVPLNDHTAVGLSSVPAPLGGAGGGIEKKGHFPTLRDPGTQGP